MKGTHPMTTAHTQARDVQDVAAIRLLSEAPGLENRRNHARFGVELDVTFASDHNFYQGFTENLSVGGIFVATHTLKAVGSKVEICLFVNGDSEPIRCSGEVRWVRVYNEHNNVPPGMGIRFVDLPDSAASAIEAFLAQRDPIFYDDE